MTLSKREWGKRRVDAKQELTVLKSVLYRALRLLLSLLKRHL